MNQRVCKYLPESVEIEDLDPGTAAREILELDRPWIGDEGPLDAEFWRLDGPELPRPLHYRGLAFDAGTTVQWDEDLVQVIRPKPAEEDVLARRSEVFLRKGFRGPGSLFRVDYIRHGVLRASRYLPGPARKEAGDA